MPHSNFFFAHVDGFTQPPAWVPCFFFKEIEIIFYKRMCTPPPLFLAPFYADSNHTLTPKNHNTVAVGGHPNPTHCHDVPVSYCPSILVSNCHGVPVSQCPSFPVSWCSRLLLSLCLSVPVPQCPSVLVSRCPSVPVSWCPSNLGGTEKRTRGGRRNAHFSGRTDRRTDRHRFI